MPACTDIVAVGRLRWIEGTTMSGKQNFAWYRFDARHSGRSDLSSVWLSAGVGAR